MPLFHQSLIIWCLLLLSAPHAQSPLPPGTWQIAEAPAALRDPISHADLIVVSLQDALLKELTHALDQGGPEFAIQSCHIDVVGAIRRVERRPGIEAGRTSDRLRNPANAPRAWAAPLVRANAGRPAREIDGFAVDLGTAVGVLRPIVEQPMCASCHGPAEKITPAVAAALKRRYPDDRAIGVVNREIRGWFWVEVPKTPR
jgi:uncharacterized protein DUF3365